MSNILSRLIVKPQVTRVNRPVSIPQIAISSRPIQILPQIIKKKTVIQTTIKQAQPAKAALPTTPVPRQIVAPAPRLDLQAVIHKIRPGRPTLKKQIDPNKKKAVKYITADVSGYEQEKIRNVRGRGNARILLIIGNGPSINEAPLEMLCGHPHIDIMSINRPDERLWPTAHWAFFDQSQMRRHKELWDNYRGIVFNSTSIKQSSPYSIKLKNLGGPGFSLDLMRGFHIGRSSVYAAMQIGLWMDYRAIYVFGCDMCEVGGKTHFYGMNPDAPRDVRLDRFATEAKYYEEAAAILDEPTRKRFTFCSSYNPYPFVEKFGRLDHLEAVPLILEQANNI